MAMSPEEKRKRETERKRRQRQAAREKPKLSALPQIGPAVDGGPGTDDGTQGGTDSVTSLTNYRAAQAVIENLEVSPALQWRAALVLQLARDLDSPLAVPQRASLAARYAENIEALTAAAKPRERDELHEMRRAFYLGGVGAIDDDPEAKRSTRKQA